MFLLISIENVSYEREVKHPEGQKPPRMHEVVPIVVTMAVRIVMIISTTRLKGRFLNMAFTEV